WAAGGDGVGAGGRRGAVLLGKEVAVRAGPGVGAEVGETLAVVEGEEAQTAERTEEHGNEQGRRLHPLPFVGMKTLTSRRVSPRLEDGGFNNADGDASVAKSASAPSYLRPGSDGLRRGPRDLLAPRSAAPGPARRSVRDRGPVLLGPRCVADRGPPRGTPGRHRGRRGAGPSAPPRLR